MQSGAGKGSGVDPRFTLKQTIEISGLKPTSPPVLVFQL
jgi:hypothetical protein